MATKRTKKIKEQVVEEKKILAIIGSAGRNEDFNHYTIEKWNESKRILLKVVQDNKFKTIISGGAAHVDHLSVQMFNKGLVDKLYLELPCNFDEKKVQYYDEQDYNTMNVTNYHHETFSQKFRINSLAQIKEAMRNGAKCTIGLGFYDRNVSIASKATDLIAFTFGNLDQVKVKSGTAHTVFSFLNRHPNGKTWHVDLNTMRIHEGIRI